MLGIKLLAGPICADIVKVQPDMVSYFVGGCSGVVIVHMSFIVFLGSSHRSLHPFHSILEMADNVFALSDRAFACEAHSVHLFEELQGVDVPSMHEHEGTDSCHIHRSANDVQHYHQ